MNSEPQRDSREDSDCCEYLSKLSPRDKPWDINRLLAKKLAHLYRGTIYHRIAERMGGCSTGLEFKWRNTPKEGESPLKLFDARFCRCRHCTVCQWRKSLRWTARFLKAFPAILRDYPNARFIFLTLTVPNCELTELRSTLTWMNESWQRMSQRKVFPAIGFARSTEVCRREHDLAGPHFHALLMVSSTYFKGTEYLSQEDWTELWRSALRVGYPPIVNVKAVRPNKHWLADNQEVTAERKLAAGVVETFKYSVKPEDLIGQETEQDRQWLLQLTKQLDKTRSVALGGIFRNYLSESDPEDLGGRSEEPDELSASSVFFQWHEIIHRYLKTWEE